MNTNENKYFSLVNDTLCYIKALLPPKEIKKKLPPAPVIPPKQQKPPPPTPTPKEEPKPLPSKTTLIKATPLKASASNNLNPVLNVLKEIAPDLYIHDTIPDDSKAKRIKESFKEKQATPAVSILHHGNAYYSFLENLAKAINTLLLPSHILEIADKEKEKKWDLFLASPQLKLIIIPDHLLFESKELLKFYKENPQKKTRTLGNIPLLLLPDLSLYFKEPSLKRSLWSVICQALK